MKTKSKVIFAIILKALTKPLPTDSHPVEEKMKKKTINKTTKKRKRRYTNALTVGLIVIVNIAIRKMRILKKSKAVMSSPLFRHIKDTVDYNIKAHTP